MPREYNKVIVSGHLGADPEMRFTPNGSAVASFRIAVSRMVGRSDSGDRREETDWFNVVAWNKLAEFCNQYLTKGQRVLVDGRLQTRSWDDQNGQKQYRTEIIANDVMFIGARPQGGGAPVGARSGSAGNSGGPDDLMEMDDLPF
jgi:single-strand DNA-binding protein